MQRLLKLTVIFTCLFSLNSSAQSYSEIAKTCSEEVFNQMNLNKRAGIIILTNIEANHAINISGLKSFDKSQLEKQLNAESKITHYQTNYRN